MKNIKYIILATAVSFTLIVSSCKKDFYTDANVNPNSPPSVTPASLLSSAEGTLAFTQGGTFDLFITLFDQQTFGANGQAAGYYTYSAGTTDFNDPWSNFYTSVFSGCKDLMTQADAKGLNAYSGVARILMAYSFQINVDVWGDMPYSQALQGVSNLYPAYDKAASIYVAIGGLVDAGIADLNASPGVLVPGAEDVIYGGNLANWIKLGHAIKARLAIHQSKHSSGAAATAITEIGQSLASNADNAIYGFGTTNNSANPWYQFESARGGYVSFKSSTLASMLSARNDPRYAIYIDSAHDALAAYYGSLNSPIELICYDEMQFVAAEAYLRNSNPVAAQTAFTAGITANMKKLGIDSTTIAAYLLTYGTLPVNNLDAIDSVSIQEYLALYLNPEAYTLWRRTNSPVLTATSGSNGVARRFLYPDTEYLLNTANVNAEGNITPWSPKLFWDN